MSVHARVAELEKQKRILDRAIQAEEALEWLTRYGPTGPQASKESIGASVSMNFASSRMGAKQAARFLEDAIGQMFDEINVRAIEIAEEAASNAKRDAS